MKKLIKFIIPIIILVFVVSCSEDDNNDTININKIDVNANITSTIEYFEEEIEIPYSITLDKTFESIANLTVVLTLDDGRAKSVEIELPANTATIDGSLFSQSEDNLVYTGYILENAANLRVTGIVLDEPIVGEDYNVVSNVFAMSSINNSNAPKMEMSLSWVGNSDLDFRYVNSSGTVIDNAETGANPELLTIFDAEPDGTYTLNIIFYSVANDPIEYDFTMTQSDGVDVNITGQFVGAVASTSAVVPSFTIVKSGANYTITQI